MRKQQDSPPSISSHRNWEVAQTIGGIEKEREITILVPQHLIGSSRHSNHYHEVIESTELYIRGGPKEGSACKVCGSTSSAAKSEFRTYREHGREREVHSSLHQSVGKCPDCGAIQNRMYGNDDGEVDLVGFSDHDYHHVNWENGKEEVYEFPYEDDFLTARLVVIVAPRIGKSYLQVYKVWRIKSRIFYIDRVTRKCMLPTVKIISAKNRWSKVKKLQVTTKNFPRDFSLPERYVAGWLPMEYFLQGGNEHG